MYCNHCGKPNEDSSKICTSCGLEIQRTEDAIIPQPVSSAQSINNSTVGNKTPSIDIKKIKEQLDGMDKKKLFTYGGIGAGALVIIIALIVIISSVTSKVSLDKYLIEELTYTGINGYGSIETEDGILDYQTLQADIFKREKGYSYDDYLFLEPYIYSYISIELVSENNGQLSNGDEVVFEIKIDKEAMKESDIFKKTISGKDTRTVKYTVEGLEEGVAIDVFDAVKCVNYDITKSYNQVSIELKDNYVKKYDKDGITVKAEDGSIMVYGDDFYSFSVRLKTTSDNYDENTKAIKLSTDCEGDRYKEYGIILAKTEAEVKANIISYVVTNTIPKADMTQLVQKAKDCMSDRLSGAPYTILKAVIYDDGNQEGNAIGFLFKYEDKINMAWYAYLKQNSDGSIVGMDDVYFKTWAPFSSYSTIEECENDIMIYQKKIDITLP